MPVRREGLYVEAAPDELNRWLGRESASKQAVHISHREENDLAAELQRGLRNARSRKNEPLEYVSLGLRIMRFEVS